MLCRGYAVRRAARCAESKPACLFKLISLWSVQTAANCVTYHAEVPRYRVLGHAFTKEREKRAGLIFVEWDVPHVNQNRQYN